MILIGTVLASVFLSVLTTWWLTKSETDRTDIRLRLLEKEQLEREVHDYVEGKTGEWDFPPRRI